MLWRKITLGVFLSFCFSFLYNGAAQAVTDDTTCTVSDYCDSAGSIDYFGCLRHKLQNGFNRKIQRACVERIKFDLASNNGSGEAVIKIKKQLVVDGEQDMDCEGNHSLCGDGISFEIMGNKQSAKVVLDTTEMADDKCAIKIIGYDMKYHGFTVRSNQPNLLGKFSENSPPNAVICEKSAGPDMANDYSGVEHDSKGGAECGNGKVEDGEECDEGSDNGKPGSTCNSNCQETSVGDEDGDGVLDDVDNCSPSNPDHDCDGNECKNPGQEDCDLDGIGDKCDRDWDGDGIKDGVDNCSPSDFRDTICSDDSLDALGKKAELDKFANAGQDNVDGDDYGDMCDDDIDGDQVPNDDNGDSVPNDGESEDNCPTVPNGPDEAEVPDVGNQEDKDSDGLGAACDPDDSPPEVDTDGDGVPDGVDNCPTVANGPGDASNQENIDGDAFGDVCDDDMDGDGKSNADEDASGCMDKTLEDTDSDGALDGADPCPCDGDDLCDGSGDPTDQDGDGHVNESDNCPGVANADQNDEDGDGVGDACDPDNPLADTDGDGTLNEADNCPTVVNDSQEDLDSDGIGDACDPQPDIADGTGIDADIEESGGGCFNSLATAGHYDLLSWLLLFGVALALPNWRKVIRTRS